MPASAEYLRDAPALWRCGGALRGRTCGYRAEHQAELPAEVLEFGAANGFTVSEMSVGDGVDGPPAWRLAQ